MKALFFANTDWYLYNFRLPLIRAAARRGWDVVLVSPPGPYVARLEREGFRCASFPMSRSGINPFAELLTLLKLIRLLRSERPDLAHHFTLKCVLHGALACRSVGTACVVGSITGLGHAFSGRGMRSFLSRTVSRPLLRIALRRSQVIFQNPEDLAEFEKTGLVPPGRSHLIRGSGVDVNRFRPVARGSSTPVVVLFMARLLREKGIGEFREAALKLRSEGVAARFLVAGDVDPGSPSSLDEATVAHWRAEGALEFLGHRDDIATVLETADIVCLPTYYREGIPRSLLEGAAFGLPLVATDVPGCREVVINEETGLLIPPRDSPSLQNALRRLIGDPSLRARMGRNSRALAENSFSEELVLASTLAVYDGALAQSAAAMRGAH